MRSRSRKTINRRGFLNVGAAGVAMGLTSQSQPLAAQVSIKADSTPAMLGGTPVRTQAFASWPQIESNDEAAWMEVLRRKQWFRGNGKTASQFETAWAEKLGAKHGLAVSSGTSALFTSLNALGVGPGDEVIVPPYTFVATINTVLLHHALPVFVDSDLETFQIDAKKVEAAITDRTACVMPVHLGGSVADMDTILGAAQRHKTPVLEDACQSHLAEWRGKKAGTLGDLGCFSFQVSKNLPSGEGGAIASNRGDLIELCRSFQNQGQRAAHDSGPGSFMRRGTNLRITEFQAALLMSQMTRLEAQSQRREQNAAYLTSLLKEIPGISPARMYDGCTRNAYHLYMFRYDKSRFEDLPRRTFLKALAAEGVPCSGGYSPLNKEPFLKETLASKGYRRIYPSEILDRFDERNACPVNDRLCEEAVWFFQTMFLGERSDMDQIADAVRKIQASGGRLAKA